MVVGSTLQSREDGHVNPVLDVRHLLAVLEEDHACPGAPKGLVCGCGHDVAEGEGRRMLAGGHQAGDVGDIRHEEGANLVCDLPELREVHHSRVCGGTAEDHGRPEDQSGFAKLVEVNESRLRVDSVWQRLEVDGRGLGNLETGQIPTPRPIVYPRSRDALVYINLGKEEKGQAGLGHEMAVGDVGWGSAARICKGRLGVTRTAWAVIRRKRVHNPNRLWAALLLCSRRMTPSLTSMFQASPLLSSESFTYLLLDKRLVRRQQLTHVQPFGSPTSSCCRTQAPTTPHALFPRSGRGAKHYSTKCNLDLFCKGAEIFFFAV